MQGKLNITGLKTSDFYKVLNELFDEEYIEELKEMDIKGEFFKQKDGIYTGKIKTPYHTFFIAFRFTSKGNVDILRFNFK